MTREEHAANKANGTYKYDRWGNQVPNCPRPHSRTGDVITNVRRRHASVSSDVFNDPLKMQAQALRDLGRYDQADKLDGLGRKGHAVEAEKAPDNHALQAKINLLRRQGRQCEANILAQQLK